MEESDSSLKDIYKSAIQAMSKEVTRLKSCLDFQELTNKLESRQKVIKTLENQVKSLTSHEQACSSGSSFFPGSSKSCRIKAKPEKIPILQDKLLDLQEKINNLKSKKWKNEEILEHKMQNLDPVLYLAVTKLLRAKKTNFNLKSQIKTLANERKNLNLTYSKITNALIQEPSANDRLAQVEDLEFKIREKEMSVKVMQAMIEQFKDNMQKNDPQVEQIFNQINSVESERKNLAQMKQEIKQEIERSSQEIERKIRNPEHISMADANNYCRAEIKKIQQEITEKSKVLRGLETEKLLVQTRLSESEKKTGKVQVKKKSLSSVNTHSSLPTDRNSSRAFGSKTPAELSLRQSSYLNSMFSREKECIVTKDLIKILDNFAPGQSITAKIIAFNRSECNLSNWSQMSRSSLKNCNEDDRGRAVRSRLSDRNQRSQLSFR